MNQSILSVPAALAPSQAEPNASRSFWRRHLWWPLLGFTLCLAALEVLSLDQVLARAWSFNALTGQWLGDGNGEWWARGLLHICGRWMVRAVAAAALALWGLSFAVPSLREWRRPAGFIALSMLLATGIVGVLKVTTNVDCPWDLAGFGGAHPYVALFADRPDALGRAQCFPGAHSSSGFALVGFYFAFRDCAPRAARWALLWAIAVGIAFSVGQEARGAHFLSHDLASAAIVWFVQLAMYRSYARASTPIGRCMPRSTKSNVSMCSGSRMR
jgi:membrane-associated PAP2 superfamily phosphatase